MLKRHNTVLDSCQGWCEKRRCKCTSAYHGFHEIDDDSCKVCGT